MWISVDACGIALCAEFVVPQVATTYPGGNRRVTDPAKICAETHRFTLRGVSVAGMASRTDLQPRLDPTHLAVARFPADWQPPTTETGGFFPAVRAGNEGTLGCARPGLADGPRGETAPLSLGHGRRRTRFAGPLPWELVGFLADVATRLAGAQIPFTSLSGFTTDHVLVRAAQADLAVTVLSGQSPPDQRPGTNP